jgi:hypothetical protein
MEAAINQFNTWIIWGKKKHIHSLIFSSLLMKKKSILMKKQTFLSNELTIDFINTTQTTIQKNSWHMMWNQRLINVKVILQVSKIKLI